MQQGGVCLGVSHRESLTMPEPDVKPDLPCPLSPLRKKSAAFAELASVLLSLRGLLCWVALRLYPVTSQ